MPHSVTIVCLAPEAGKDATEALDRALAAFSENREVEPYRDYVEGEPKDYWAVASLREKQHLNPDDATPTWTQVARAYTQAYPTDEMGISEDGRAYTMTQYPPEVRWPARCPGQRDGVRRIPPKERTYRVVHCTNREDHPPHEMPDAMIGGARWDWWSVGGRWTGYFKAVEGADRELLINPRPRDYDGAAAELAMLMPDHLSWKADGGPRGLLDFEKQRDADAALYGKRWDDFHKLVASSPHLLPWSHFRGLVGTQEGYTIAIARSEYQSQGLRELLKGTEFAYAMECPLDTYSGDRRAFVDKARRHAVPGYALLDLEGVWHEPGVMGWWGMDSSTEESTEAYKEWANDYLEGLPGDVILVAVDVHI